MYAQDVLQDLFHLMLMFLFAIFVRLGDSRTPAAQLLALIVTVEHTRINQEVGIAFRAMRDRTAFVLHLIARFVMLDTPTPFPVKPHVKSVQLGISAPTLARLVVTCATWAGTHHLVPRFVKLVSLGHIQPTLECLAHLVRWATMLQMRDRPIAYTATLADLRLATAVSRVISVLRAVPAITTTSAKTVLLVSLRTRTAALRVCIVTKLTLALLPPPGALFRVMPALKALFPIGAPQIAPFAPLALMPVVVAATANTAARAVLRTKPGPPNVLYATQVRARVGVSHIAGLARLGRSPRCLAVATVTRARLARLLPHLARRAARTAPPVSAQAVGTALAAKRAFPARSRSRPPCGARAARLAASRLRLALRNVTSVLLGVRRGEAARLATRVSLAIMRLRAGSTSALHAPRAASPRAPSLKNASPAPPATSAPGPRPPASHAHREPSLLLWGLITATAAFPEHSLPLLQPPPA